MLKNKELDKSIKGWLVVFVGGLFYLYQFALRVSPNIMHNELLQIFSIDAGTLGTVIGAYYWAYTMMQLPLGMTMDRLGPRYFLCAAAFLCGLSCFIFGHTHNVYIAAGARFLMGMGSACGLVGTIKLGTIWLKPKHIAKVTSLAILMGTAGAGLGGVPLRYVLTIYGLKTTMEMLALVGVLVGIIIYISVRVHPPINQRADLTAQSKNNHPITDLLIVIRSKQAWILALYGMLMYAPITVIGIAWGTPFIREYYDISETLAVSIVSTMFLGAALGSPIVAFISDMLKNRRLPMVLGGVTSLLVWATVIFIPGIPLAIMYVLFFCGGIAYTFKTLSFASICDVLPRELSGTSIAFVNMVVMATGIIFHPLIGHLMDYHRAGTLVAGMPYYSLNDYKFALTIIPISALLSIISMIFMRESHPESNSFKEYGISLDRDAL